jgi:hypothetical protein
MSAAGESGLRIVIATRAEGQRIAELDAEIDALRRQALALGAEPIADVQPWTLLGLKIGARRGGGAPNPWQAWPGSGRAGVTRSLMLAKSEIGHTQIQTARDR